MNLIKFRLVSNLGWGTRLGNRRPPYRNQPPPSPPKKNGLQVACADHRLGGRVSEDDLSSAICYSFSLASRRNPASLS
jgi:hypothetical protein